MATVVLTSTQRIQLGLFLLSAEIQNRDTRTTSTHQGWPFFIVMIVVETGSFYNVGWPHDFEQSCSLILTVPAYCFSLFFHGSDHINNVRHVKPVS